MNNAALIAVLLGSTLAAGCSFENTMKLLSPTAPSGEVGGTGTPPLAGSTSPTNPTSQTVPGFSGTWGSPAIAGLPIGNCSDVQWSISSQSANSSWLEGMSSM